MKFCKMFTQVVLKEQILVPFVRCYSLKRYFLSYAKDKIEGKCRNEGYVSIGSVTVLNYSCGLLFADSVSFDVTYQADVCKPEVDQIVPCKIIHNTKIGIRGLYQEGNNPIIFFVSREHNPDKNFEEYAIGQTIQVKLLGTRFELNDTAISAIAEII
jgi:DNA-directed RNA polymerase subunit E'/Rpb7